MSEQSIDSAARTEVQAHLHAIARLLREVHRLESEAQALLADLMDELANALESTAVPSAHVATLTASTSDLVQAVHEKHEPGMLVAAEERLENAVVAVEAKAPALASLTRRLAEMLSDLGI
jgi:phage host-nuclease inhibitor protein Gam